MGLFDAFKKKNCDICGGEIGLLGNRKLEDGNMCKVCAAKLSPWFDERRHSTLEQIKEQLAYREANKEKVKEFRTTLTYGEDAKIHIDEDAGLFMIASTGRLLEENPDVLAFSDITGCLIDIDEDKDEIMKEGSDGEEISYNPPRYTYSYDFFINIQVRNPYFDDMRIKLNSNTVEIEENPVRRALGNRFDPKRDQKYTYYKDMCEEIKAALLEVRKQGRDEEKAASAPNLPVNCPYCGAVTTPDENGRCEFCGGAI